MSNLTTLVSIITTKLDEGYEPKQIKGYLNFNHPQLTDKEIKEAFDSLGLSGNKKQFADIYYDWLSVAPRTEFEMNEYIMGLGEYGETSNNVQKHLSHYLKIGRTIQRVWDAVDAE